MRYLCVRVINLFPFIIYVIENVIYVSMNFELRPTRRVVNLSPKAALSIHSYTLWVGALVNLPKLKAEVHGCFPHHLLWRKKVGCLGLDGT